MLNYLGNEEQLKVLNPTLFRQIEKNWSTKYYYTTWHYVCSKHG